MPRVENIPAGGPARATDITLADAEAELAAAEAALEELLAERRRLRATLPRAEWRKHNEATAADQIAAAAAVEDARRLVARLRRVEARRVQVQAAAEGEGA